MNIEPTPGSSLNIELPDGATMHCIVDDYTDPWTTPDVVVMLHGIAEDARIWRAWAPHFAGHYRVIRVDLRGFGKSSNLPPGKLFRIEDWAEDIMCLVAKLGHPRVHLIATKLGSQIAFDVAQRQPGWLASMTIAGMLPSPSKSLGRWVPEWISEVEQEGVIGWARSTMPGRMSEYLSPAAYQWWLDLMGSAPAASVINCFRLLPDIHEAKNPERVQCPTLFLLAGVKETLAAAYSQRPPEAAILELQQRVQNSRYAMVDAASYHIAATHPDLCAQATLEFLTSLKTSGS